MTEDRELKWSHDQSMAHGVTLTLIIASSMLRWLKDALDCRQHGEARQEGQALGWVLMDAHRLVDMGAPPAEVRKLLSVTLGDELALLRPPKHPECTCDVTRHVDLPCPEHSGNGAVP